MLFSHLVWAYTYIRLCVCVCLLKVTFVPPTQNPLVFLGFSQKHHPIKCDFAQVDAGNTTSHPCTCDFLQTGLVPRFPTKFPERPEIQGCCLICGLWSLTFQFTSQICFCSYLNEELCSGCDIPPLPTSGLIGERPHGQKKDCIHAWQRKLRPLSPAGRLGSYPALFFKFHILYPNLLHNTEGQLFNSLYFYAPH